MDIQEHSGPERVIDKIRNESAKKICLIGQTYSSIKKHMIEGPSGLLAEADRRDIKYTYNRFSGEVRFHDFNAVCKCIPMWPVTTINHPYRFKNRRFDFIWCDRVKIDDKHDHEFKKYLMLSVQNEKRILYST
ncbi:hypothetical protein [Piscirickettsia litoralis]|uniref:Uncharacterized protein n=1 Tax=Piscirickettsia litoralis TaxID=1891921 RepID=A0ABX2ZYV3_9GAMM|nr:hypothetical protein [Piscirickettsia litoralis]ODN41806.1 hypothetical protein BGC07_00935 [Piscirickettsia litoralis]